MREVKPFWLFTASCVAIAATAMTFAIRADLIGVLGKQFQLSSEEIGLVSGTAFWGFTLSMIFGGVLLNKTGIRVLVFLALTGHIAGIVLTIFSAGFWSLFYSTLLVGIGNGLVEAAVNPLVAGLYPDKKTEKLNLLHVWFPAGIVLGGFVVHFFHEVGFSWQWQMATILIPVIAYGILLLPLSFPTEAKSNSENSSSVLFNELRRPLFLLLVFCMLLTAATELGTNQWIAVLLKNATTSPILLLVFINGIMVVGRLLAGKVEHLFSTIGMLVYSSVFSCIGLVLLGILQGASVFIAAGIFALGICYFWPTMLAYVSKYMPGTGAVGLSIMGGAGMLSVSLILPLMGSMFDSNLQALLPAGASLEELRKAKEGSADFVLLDDLSLQAGKSTLMQVAVFPSILVVVFGLLFLFHKRKKWA